VKRFPVRKPRNYRWIVEELQADSVTDGAVSHGPLLIGADLLGGTGRGHVNLKRFVFDLQFMIRTEYLEVAALAGAWAFMHYALLIVDVDDTTTYDPGFPPGIGEETSIRDGFTDRIGWGTIAPAGGAVSQSAAFMAQTRISFDVKSNRRFTTDQAVRIYTRLDDQTEFGRTLDPDIFGWYCRLRTLYEVP